MLQGALFKEDAHVWLRLAEAHAITQCTRMASAGAESHFKEVDLARGALDSATPAFQI